MKLPEDHPHHFNSLLKIKGSDVRVRVESYLRWQFDGFGMMRIYFDNGEYYWLTWKLKDQNQ